MEWYFVENGQKNGPHQQDAFEELIRSGKVGPKTLVWRAGMDNWQPLEEARPPQPAPMAVPASAPVAAAVAEPRPAAATVRPEAAAAEPVSGPAAARVAASVASSTTAPVGSSTATQVASSAAAPVSEPTAARAAAPARRPAPCGVCGTERSAEDLMRFRGTLVCPECKPAFVQRMREGTSQPGQLRYAGFWIRFAAKFIDGLILGVVSFVITMITGAAMAGMMAGGDGEPALGTFMAVQGVNMVLQLAVQIAFVTYFLPRYSATPGKMATGLIVVRSDGSTLTAGRAFGRCFGEWLSSLTLGIGYIMAAFDEEKRALHDRVCDTRVAYKAARA